MITVAIPVFNGGRTLARLLQAVARQSRPPDELLVVDDGSTDDSAAIARRAGARLLAHPGNRGLAAARNTCLEQARGEIIVFLDADAIPEPDCLRRLCQGYTDPLLAGIGGQLLEAPCPGGLPDRWRALFWVQTQGATPREDAPFLIGGCCSLRRRAALAVGGFSPDFRTNGEDVELSLRLRRRGWRLRYEPAAAARHLRQDGLLSLLTMIHRHQRDHLRALRRHEEPWSPVVRSALRWGPVTLASSLRRHRSLPLAILSPLCYLASLSGCAAPFLAPGR